LPLQGKAKHAANYTDYTNSNRKTGQVPIFDPYGALRSTGEIENRCLFPEFPDMIAGERNLGLANLRDK
jgi:hypothetical protein